MGFRGLTNHGYKDTLDALVGALCADYERRKDAMTLGSVNKRCAMEYKYINYLMLEGAAEVVGERYAELYINEIGRRIGYAKTEHPAVDENTYKLSKQAVKMNIAKKLHLF
ncbi:MAG: hypothetical protein IKC32_06735 [Clostridia bacterium]|nr:hypothetical protein [Clostridia bacterium]